MNEKDRKELLGRALDYIHQYKEEFSWNVLKAVGKNVYKGEVEEIMKPLQISLDMAEARGIEKGIEKGREEGIEKGREEERKKLALSMLKDDFNVDIIIRHTGLVKAEIEHLAKKHGLSLKHSE